jgi:hypothetical protein
MKKKNFLLKLAAFGTAFLIGLASNCAADGDDLGDFEVKNGVLGFDRDLLICVIENCSINSAKNLIEITNDCKGLIKDGLLQRYSNRISSKTPPIVIFAEHKAKDYPVHNERHPNHSWYYLFIPWKSLNFMVWPWFCREVQENVTGNYERCFKKLFMEKFEVEKKCYSFNKREEKDHIRIFRKMSIFLPGARRLFLHVSSNFEQYEDPIGRTHAGNNGLHRPNLLGFCFNVNELEEFKKIANICGFIVKPVEDSYEDFTLDDSDGNFDEDYYEDSGEDIPKIFRVLVFLESFKKSSGI